MPVPDVRAARGVKQFRRDAGGVAAVEMAIIAPMLVAAFLGVADVGLALMKYRQAVQTASSIAHTAAYLSVKDAKASPNTAVMSASSASSVALSKGLNLSLADIAGKSTATAARMVRRTTTNQVWTWTYSGSETVHTGTSAPPVIPPSAAPSMTDGESVIAVEVAYQHAFMFMPGSVRISSRYFAHVPAY